MSSLVNEIKKRFVASARTKRTRNCKTGRLSLRNPCKIAADSSFVFNRKTKGTNRRVAVAGSLDWSGSMAGYTSCSGKKACVAKLKKLSKVDPWFKPHLATAMVIENGSPQDNHCYIYVNDMCGSHGHLMGVSSENGSPTSAASGTVSLSINGKTDISPRYNGNEPKGAKVLMSFTCAYGQWVGANLIRKALNKLGIANFWCGFTHNPFTICDWGDRGDVIMPVQSFGGTNSAVGFATMIDQLRTRNEERRIAILFTDGDVGRSNSVVKDRTNLTKTNQETANFNGKKEYDKVYRETSSYNKAQDAYNASMSDCNAAKNKASKGGHENVTTLLKDAWKEGIEVYVIGIGLGESCISSIEDVVGKGHAVGVQDIATELPAVIAEIIGNDEKDLKKTSHGAGYGIAAHQH